ncbi:MAG: ABC transporter ATP-binding protein [Acidobacteriota bacterium]
MTERQPLVVVMEDVHKAYGEKAVLRGVSLQARRGETVAILGGSGSGKSVLLKHLNGLIRPDRGRIAVLGCDVAQLPEGDLVELRRRVSYIFQGAALFDSLSVGENIAFPMVEHRVGDARQIEDRVAELLESVGLSGAERLMPAELSGGMKKRIALARGLALEPELVLYDEPTAGLDPLTGQAIAELIATVAAAAGVTSLVVTHDLALARALGGRVAFLRDGVIEFLGPLQDAAGAPGVLGEFVRAGGVHA